MKLGVFDSGIGGEAIAASLQIAFPDAVITTVNDKKHVPYGTKSPSEVIRLTDTAIAPLLTMECDVIVLACNTATAYAIDYLRTKYPGQRFIGIEPMIKTAAHLTTAKKIAVFATTATLASDRYHGLKQKYAQDITVLEPDCSDWAYLIENNQINRSHIESVVNTACTEGADVIVLGCTHYHWIKELIESIARDRAIVIEPSQAIGARVRQLLELR